MSIKIEVGTQFQLAVSVGNIVDYTYEVHGGPSRVSIDSNGLGIALAPGTAVISIRKTSTGKVIDKVMLKVYQNEDISPGRPQREDVTEDVDTTAPVISTFSAAWSNDQLSIQHTGASDPETGIQEVRLTAKADDNSDILVTNGNVTNSTSSNYGVLKNGKTYDITIRVVNNYKLVYTNTVSVEVPIGYGTGGYGHSGYGA